jgi:hypothetical protein
MIKFSRGRLGDLPYVFGTRHHRYVRDRSPFDRLRADGIMLLLGDVIIHSER